MSASIEIFAEPSGRYCMTVTDADGPTEALFQELELQGGGYTWQGIIEALVRPSLQPQLEIGAEADNMHVHCNNREVLEGLADLLRRTIADQDSLRDLISSAGEDIE